jgi:hypothetical protein
MYSVLLKKATPSGFENWDGEIPTPPNDSDFNLPRELNL